MRRKATTLLEILAHPITQDAVRSIAQGNDPRGVLAGMAGDLFAQEVGKVIGARQLPSRSRAKNEPRKPAAKATNAPGVKHRPKVEVVSEDDVVDAEYTVIDVTPRGAKKAG